MIGEVISRDPSLLAALTTSLNLEALHDLVEVMRIDAHNARVIRKIDKDA